jgi:hypothetical protein
MTKTYVFFAVFEFGDDLDAVTSAMEHAPTEAWLRGDPTPGHPTAKRTHSRWTLSSGLPTNETFEVQLAALLIQLESRADRVRAVMSRWSAGVMVAIYTSMANPGMHLSATDVRRLAELGLPIDFDIYCLPEAPDSEA